jgi:hypothetical protein
MPPGSFGFMPFCREVAENAKAAQPDLPNSCEGPIISPLCVAGIAQLVEQLICNQKVPSSILGAGTRNLGCYGGSLELFAVNVFDRKVQYRHN